MEMLPHGFSLGSSDDAFQIVNAGLTNFRQRAEMHEQFLGRFQADSLDFREFRCQRPSPAPFAVKIDGEAMAFVPDLLDKP